MGTTVRARREIERAHPEIARSFAASRARRPGRYDRYKRRSTASSIAEGDAAASKSSPSSRNVDRIDRRVSFAVKQPDRRRRGPRASPVARSVAMDRSEYKVKSPPKPPRKVRRKPVTKREQGLEAACRDGQFVLLSEPEGTPPHVSGLRQMSLVVYNRVADLKFLKIQVEAALQGAEGEWRKILTEGLTSLNRRIGDLRDLGYRYRTIILEAEGFQPVNEPKNWARI